MGRSKESLALKLWKVTKEHLSKSIKRETKRVKKGVKDFLNNDSLETQASNLAKACADNRECEAFREHGINWSIANDWVNTYCTKHELKHRNLDRLEAFILEGMRSGRIRVK